MRSVDIDSDPFIIGLLDKLIRLVERDSLDRTGESFWFSIYELPHDQDVANRANDEKTRALVDLLIREDAIQQIQKIEIDYRPSNVSVSQETKLLDSVEIKVKNLGAIRQLVKSLSAGLNSESTKAVYDSHRRKLTIAGQQVSFSGPSEKPLMEALFRNRSSRSKKWHNDELAAVYDPVQTDSVSARWGTNTATNINRKLKAETGIADLFLVTEGTVKVNSKYL